MSNKHISEIDFLTSPPEFVRSVAPITLILGAGGTRRRSELMSKRDTNWSYLTSTRDEMFRFIELLFSFGVQHIFVPVIVDGNFNEVTPGYKEMLFNAINQQLAGDDSLHWYQEQEIQARLVGSEMIDELSHVAAKLMSMTPQTHCKSLWYTVTSSSIDVWNFTLARLASTGVDNHRDALIEIYGQAIPTDDIMLLDFGKPQVFASVVPPLLSVRVHCYWRQHLGYAFDETMVRKIFYDYAFLRRTWQQDKSGRAKQIYNFVDEIENPPVIGLGKRIGPFWYPDLKL